jgi:hypothetical protein
MMKRFKCFHPENNLGIDVVLNEKTEKMRLCVNYTKNESLLRNLTKKCLRNCRENCITEYTSFYLFSEEEKNNSKTTIKLQITNNPIFEYSMYSKLSLVNYASNLGSIISMWFGFSVIDLHKLFELLLTIFIYISKKFNLILDLDKILRNLLSLDCIGFLILIKDNIKSIFHKLQKFKWKLLFKILCILCFVYQTIEMTTEYLRYETLVEVKAKSYTSNEDTNPFPALSICGNSLPENNGNDILVDETGKDFKRFFGNYKLIKNTYTPYININNHNFTEVLSNQTLISDYLNVIDLRHDFQFKYCSIRHGIELDYCKNFLNLITSYSKDIKCYTINSRLSESFKETLKINGYITLRYKSMNLLYIHDVNDLPTFQFSKMSSIGMMKDTIKYYDKMQFIRLPAPYDTNCHYYKNKVRSKNHCFNQMVHKMFLENNCLPKNHESLAYVIENYNYTQLRYKFCSNSLNFKCKKLMSKCHKSCIEDIYEIWESIGSSPSYDLKTSYPQYISFEHKPQLEFIQYLINFGGLLGLWHGISLIDLKNFAFNSIYEINFWDKFKRKFGKYVNHSKIPLRMIKKFKIKVILILNVYSYKYAKNEIFC